jgi:aspartate/methionine/tyrosine aminotransferase
VSSAGDRAYLGKKVGFFTESVIREMTRLAMHYGAVNLAQGFPDFPAPSEVKQAAVDAIRADVNQYAVTWGAPAFREAIAAKYQRHYGVSLDPASEITVVCGSTEGMIASLLAVTDPGDEIVIFEPWYENYGPDAHLCSAVRRFVSLRPPDWSFDPDELRAAFSPRTRAVILNSPNNPTGKVFTRAELEQVAALCQEFDALCVTDEIYEHILYDGAEHIPMLTMPGMRERTSLVNSMSKSFSVTGWRVGWVIAQPDITAGVRKVHDFLTVGAAAPLQQAGVVALQLPDSYYAELAQAYRERRDLLADILMRAGFRLFPPQGAYYIMADIAGFGYSDDVAFCQYLIEKVGVASVPGSSFFSPPAQSSQNIRFCFCKKCETLEEAGRRLQQMFPS